MYLICRLGHCMRDILRDVTAQLHIMIDAL